MPNQMRYIAYDSQQPGSDLQIQHMAVPAVGNEQLLLRVTAFALNRADLLQRQGKYPPPPGDSEVLGLEVSGEVISVGADVSNWQVGDAVCGLVAGGGYAEYALIDAKQAIAVPSGMEIVTAAGLAEVFLTAYQSLFSIADLKPKERVLIHAGASGVGLAAIQLAKLVGCDVACTASSADKLAQCKEYGAQLLINYKEQDFAIQLKQLKWQANVIVDVVAGDYIAGNLNVASLDARIIYLAMLGGRVGQIDMAKMLAKRITMVGSTLRNRSVEYKRALVKSFCQSMVAHFTTGELVVPVDSILPVNSINEAHQRMQSNQTQGKVIITWD
ncbi:NAD(P)H-quinone oxidoreductase [Alteromonas facilis]|uniref:NAD(P)H-quinone oxidoreductase n=1 Tax=Alteromonas facilis TaxID=2048004 RepID=UPI000C281742|nr:NAD(P)H-quinone oxidoreductase [Alteromonas facilis]